MEKREITICGIDENPYLIPISPAFAAMPKKNPPIQINVSVKPYTNFFFLRQAENHTTTMSAVSVILGNLTNTLKARITPATARPHLFSFSRDSTRTITAQVKRRYVR